MSVYILKEIAKFFVRFPKAVRIVYRTYLKLTIN